MRAPIIGASGIGARHFSIATAAVTDLSFDRRKDDGVITDDGDFRG
jgi:hypothetical protein